jgi:hypothetical protein
MRLRPLLLLICLALLSGCSKAPEIKFMEVRSILVAAAKAGDPDFPDGRNVQLTYFSHIGELHTNKGALIYVVDTCAVLTGMPAPRGLNYIVFFDEHFHYLGKINYSTSRPLWCEGSKLYLYGDLDGLGDYPEGNVIDLAEGYENLAVYHASVYGSSGGIYD